MVASHIACEASCQGLEAQIAALHKGYGDEITRLQGLLNAPPKDHKQQMAQLHSQLAAQAASYGEEIGRLQAQIDNIRNQATLQMNESIKQHDTRIAQLKAQHFGQLERLKVEQEQNQNNYTRLAKVEWDKKALELEQQAKQHQERNTLLTARLNDEKAAHETTKHSMSSSISQIRLANKAKITELETQLESFQKRVAGDPKAGLQVKLRRTMYTQEFEYSGHGVGTLSNLAKRLSRDITTLNDSNTTFFLPCKIHFALRELQDHSKRLHENLISHILGVAACLMHQRRDRATSGLKAWSPVGARKV
ncbi:hypothetical protein LTR97_007994 [Elasticomyces elasticus]|uniref:Uncharacterized protein n=1 Tax=Elasticomyces elasticus TaxID=574655 RepID=A0AAN7ZZK3_9PEZI|nr:hypothetical protein LTR97_007994 [Elasticomyces elasticus]